MSSNKDSVQRAIICLITMVCTLSYGTLNALISVTVHINSSFLFDMLIMSEIRQSIRLKKYMLRLTFSKRISIIYEENLGFPNTYIKDIHVF